MISQREIELARLEKRLQEYNELDAFYEGLLFGNEDGAEAAELWIQKNSVMRNIVNTITEIEIAKFYAGKSY